MNSVACQDICVDRKITVSKIRALANDLSVSIVRKESPKAIFRDEVSDSIIVVYESLPLTVLLSIDEDNDVLFKKAVLKVEDSFEVLCSDGRLVVEDDSVSRLVCPERDFELAGKIVSDFENFVVE